MSPVSQPLPDPLSPARSPVSLASPARWLALGWADLRNNPVPGLFHGFLLTAFGALLLWAAGEKFWLLAGAFSGFLIVAPILATGLYRVSRACESGRCVGMAEVVSLWRSGDRRLVVFGLLLGLAGTGWVLTSAGLITLWSPQPIQKPADFLRHVVLVHEVGLFEVWLLLGAIAGGAGVRLHGGGPAHAGGHPRAGVGSGAGELARGRQPSWPHGRLGGGHCAAGRSRHGHRVAGPDRDRPADRARQLARLPRSHRRSPWLPAAPAP